MGEHLRNHPHCMKNSDCQPPVLEACQQRGIVLVDPDEFQCQAVPCTRKQRLVTLHVHKNRLAILV